MAMIVAKAEQAEVVLCGHGTVKTAELDAEEGILKTALILLAQVQVRHTWPPTDTQMHTGLGASQTVKP